MPRNTSNRVEYDGRLALAIKAYNLEQFNSLRSCAAAYDILLNTLIRRVRGGSSRARLAESRRNLTNEEADSLVRWVLDLANQGHPVRFNHIRFMANQLLSVRCSLDSKVGKNWVGRFVKQRPELRTQRYRKYAYQRALCEDPKKVREWFDLVRNMIRKYGVPPSDVWNFDESGFAMGVLGSSLVVTGVENTTKQASIQAGNREWVTTIDAISAEGESIPPMFIFKGKVHQSTWYNPEWFEPDWTVGLSETGWTNDDLGLAWLKNVFDPPSNRFRQGVHRILVMDGHGSHETPAFDAACKERNIIPIYMPPHSSHLLQPLDVGLFSPLKRAYTKELENTFRMGINHVDKIEFLETYKRIRPQVFTKSNILGAFRGAGLHPLEPAVVLDLLHNVLGPSTPENEPERTLQSSPWEPHTPHTSKDLLKQKEALSARLQGRSRRLSSPTQRLLDQVVKGCQMAMSGATILATENIALRTANEKQKRKRTLDRSFIGEGGVLSGVEAQARLVRPRIDDIQSETGPNQSLTTRAPPRCSICRSLDHNARKFPNKTV